jgi:bifunctional UDP-N-acetylglucosamine pyrophosphorylase/glucosamine-1-phosphate N-acetyltransferase
VTIHPFTVVRGDVRIGEGAELGPFAYVRPGTSLGERGKIGAFVEVKNSRIGARTKVPHLSYIGDAEVGEGTNIGAGAVTANFKHEPGLPKARTTIGSNVRTGINNVFDAPVTIGDDAWIAPGAVITDDVPPGSLAGFAPRQETKEGWVYEKHGKPDS